MVSQKKIGSSKAAQTPLIAPKVWPKLNILVTPCPGIAFTCSTTTAISASSLVLSLIILTSWALFNCLLFFFPSAITGISKIFNIAINSGAKDCSVVNGFHEIVTQKDDFYKIKTELEKKIDSFAYSAIEWRPQNNLNLDKDQSKKMIEVLNALEELDDVQNVFTNANLDN